MSSTLALLLPASGSAQSNYGQSNRQQSNYGQSSRQQSQQYSPSRGSYQTSGSGQYQRTITGEIEGFRHVRMGRGGMGNTHSLIRVSLDNGRTLVMDAGPKQNLDQFKLQQGDRIQARGRFVTTSSGQQMFAADRLRIDGQTVAVQRMGAQQRRGSFASQSSRRQTGRQVTLTGSIEGFRHIDVRNNQGERQTHTLAKVSLDNGRTTFLDLGPKQRLSHLSLEKGEKIRVQAQPGTIDNRQIMLVNRLALPSRQHGQTTQRTSGAQQRQVTLQGKVRGYQIMSIGTGEQQQVLLSLQLQDGRSILVDAGKYQPGELDLKDLNINDRVTIKARQTRSGNRQIMVADSIQFQDSVGGSSNRPQTQSSGRSRSSQ